MFLSISSSVEITFQSPRLPRRIEASLITS
jgi:hypothetical protein